MSGYSLPKLGPGMVARPSRTSEREPERRQQRPSGAKVISTIEKANGYTVSLAVIDREGCQPILSIRIFAPNGRPFQSEFRLQDLDALEEAIAATRAAAKRTP